VAASLENIEEASTFLAQIRRGHGFRRSNRQEEASSGEMTLIDALGRFVIDRYRSNATPPGDARRHYEDPHGNKAKQDTGRGI
jgi:hypothetical protein